MEHLFCACEKISDICTLFLIDEMTIEEIQEQIAEEFSMFEEWMDKYAYLIEQGNLLPPMDVALKTDQYLIKGCQSRVWLVPEMREGKLWFTGESDAIIVKGLVALTLRVASGRTPRELMESNFHFIDDIGLRQHLSPTRSNGLLSMIKQIRLYAVAYNKLDESRNG